MIVKVFESFAGYGSQSMALERIKKENPDFDYEVVGISEIDKYAIQAYNAIHGDDIPNFGDITKIDWDSVPDFDMFTYSFPCQDISSAGKQRGLAEGSETRSSLLWECKKAIEAKKPKYLLMENVKALTQKKFLPYLHEWERYLGSLGYTNFTEVLNAKNYGVPQNRERVFMVSVLGDAWYEFPEPFALDKRLKDVLEKDVDKKYYLSEKIINTFVRRTYEAKQKGNGFAFIVKSENDIAHVVKHVQALKEDNYISEPTSCAMRGRNPNNPSDRTAGIPTEQRIEVGGYVANCITSVQKDSMIVEPNVLTPKRTEYGKQVRKMFESGDLKESRHNMTEMQPRKDGVCNTITSVQKDNILQDNYRIRKLTERECFRLMGVSDSDIDKIQKAGISRTQQYKLAGNSIVVDVLYYIFKEMFMNNYD